MEYGFLDLCNSIKSKLFYVIVLCFFSCYFCHEYLKDKQKWYSYEMLIRSGSLEEETSDGFDSPLLKLKSNNEVSGTKLKTESAAFIKFKYSNLLELDKNIKAYLHSIEDVQNTDYIKLTIYSVDKNLAEEFGNEIFKGITLKYKNIIDQKKYELGEVVAFSKKAKDTLSAELEVLDRSIKRIGFSPTLYERKVSLEQDIFKLSRDILNKEILISSDSVRDFSIVDRRLSSEEAVYPNIPLYLVVCGVFSFFAFLFMFLLYDRMRWEKDLRENEDEYDNDDNDDNDEPSENEIGIVKASNL